MLHGGQVFAKSSILSHSPHNCYTSMRLRHLPPSPIFNPQPETCACHNPIFLWLRRASSLLNLFQVIWGGPRAVMQLSESCQLTEPEGMCCGEKSRALTGKKDPYLKHNIWAFRCAGLLPEHFPYPPPAHSPPSCCPPKSPLKWQEKGCLNCMFFALWGK